MNPDDLAYLATPYSRYKGGPARAYKDACKLAAKLLLAGIKAYSPIAHTHGIAIHGALDCLDHSIWLPFDEAMMKAADVLIVARMEGWEDSFGIAHEVKFFESAGKPIFDLDPATMVMTRRPETGQEPLLTDDRIDERSPIVTQLPPFPFNKSRSEHGGGSA